MKKLLLFYFFTVGFGLNAQQVFCEEYATGFSNKSSSVGQISYADANNVWTYATDEDGSGNVYQIVGRSLDSGHTWGFQICCKFYRIPKPNFWDS